MSKFMDKLKGLQAKLRKQWVVRAEEVTAVPRMTDQDVYRFPPPGSQPRPKAIDTPEELRFNTKLFSRPKQLPDRHQLQKPEKQRLDPNFPPGTNAPNHTPMPGWMRDPKDLEFLHNVYLKSGVILPGRHGLKYRWEMANVVADRVDSDMWRLSSWANNTDQDHERVKPDMDHLPASNLGHHASKKDPFI